MASPLLTVKKQFPATRREDSKEALVEKLLPILDRDPDESEGEFKDRLMRVSNKKLLRLQAREETLRTRFNSRERLVDEIVKLKMGRDDADYRHKLQSMKTGRLLDLHRSLS